MNGHRARLVALAVSLAPIAALSVVAPALAGGGHRPSGNFPVSGARAPRTSPTAPTATPPRTPTAVLRTPTAAPPRTAPARPAARALRPASVPIKAAAASASTWRTRLTASFTKLRPTLPARSVGVAMVAVGRSDPVTLGTWRSGPAWSTAKIPLAIAALAHADSTSTRTLVKKAITRSDNAAAEALWARLGSGRRAASRVDAVLRADGDHRTRTQWRKVRAPYTPFGQTQWSLADQLRFTTGLACDRRAALVRADMGVVVSSQRWGLGRLAHARLKGGWGPDTRGRYLVRQLALVPRARGLVAVVVAVEPSDGSFAQGVRTLDKVASWLRTSMASLPSSGAC